MTPPLLDTHAWLWWIGRDGRMPKPTHARLDAFPAHRRPYLSAISLWETAMLVERRRIAIDGPLDMWLADACQARNVQLLPITPAVAAATATLPADFQRDPADRIIVATCRAHDVPLLTFDRAIRRSDVVDLWPA